MFAQQMKKLRLDHHMTQAELAERLGVSASAVGMYEQGRREPDLSMIMKLCNIFGVPADLLLGADQPTESFEIKDVIQDLEQRLRSTKHLTLDGTPMTPQDIHRLINAIEVSTALVLNDVERTDTE